MTKISQKNIYFRFKKYIASHDLVRAGDKLIVACSGGPDSISLLYLLKKLSADLNLTLVVSHFNHGIRGREADADEKFVENTAKKLGLKYRYAKAEKEINSEEQAREERYAFLEKSRVEEGANLIAVAHNLDDLSETMVHNIIRGTGIRGLYSLRPKRARIIRPLLFAKKNDILSYLSENEIAYRVDQSNKEMVYTRNIIRHKILPKFEMLNPSYSEALSRLSSTSAEIDDFIRQYSLEIFGKLSDNKNGKIIFSQKKFITLSPAIQKEIVRIIATEYHITKDLSEAEVSEVVALANKNVGKKQKVLKSKLKIELDNGKIVVSKTKGDL